MCGRVPAREAGPREARTRRGRGTMRWLSWTGYAAAGWSVLYALIGFYWASGGSSGYALAGSVAARPVAWGITALGLTGAVIALATVRPWGLGVSRRVLATEAWTISAL